MAVVHETEMRTIIAQAVLDQIDNGTGGYLLFEDGTGASPTEIARIDFAATAGTVTGALLTFTLGGGISDTSPANAGTIVQASIFESDDTKILDCTAGTSADITISSATISTTDTVTLTALTYTAPT